MRLAALKSHPSQNEGWGGWPTLENRGCPTLAFFARVGIRDLSGLGMLVVGIRDLPPIEMHDGWGSLSCDSLH